MVKKKSKQQVRCDELPSDKPDFEQALSFAATMPQTATQLDEPMTSSSASFVTPVQSAASLLPQDSASRKVLEARARVIAKPASLQQHVARDHYLQFRLGPVELYGIPYHYLEELLYVGNLARVPCTPAFVAGVINYRGELLTLLDLKQFFRVDVAGLGEDARIIVVKYGSMRVGLLVDAVDGNESYQDTEVLPPLSSDGVSNMDYVLGIHQGRVTLLNLQALLEDTTLRVTR